ncbi:MAG: hypothetical protein U0401_20525 [Anaerolineae bacterium]
MKKLFKLIAITTLFILISHLPLTNPPISHAISLPQSLISNYQSAEGMQSAITNLQSPPPDIPTIIDQLYFGVPAGNGHEPQWVVVDNRRGRLYTLNNGLSDTHEGNTISVIDLQTGQVTDLLRLNIPGRQSLLAELHSTILSPLRALDLQLDPTGPASML